jgi:hypothetical protein
MDIEAHTYWLHKEEGYCVMVVDTVVRTKDDSESAWSAGIAYRREDEKDIVPNIMYVRKRDNFLDKFERPEVLGEDA